ncbi:hypothetical protein HN385_06950 [archaeon]|jgi:inner membrane protein|nr:hypothetical protein [archaeon]MBT3451011.1 hypothetical protein [archaeon]MBT6868569.1 hypothetical protein [archaeon]MBT7193101.1 hypothetical protein [archaeon]MBT7380418.1 hypothetical protein [archaeon]
MLFHGHLLVGMLVFLLTYNFFDDIFTGGNIFVIFLLVLLGSLLPDIDEKGTTINKWFGFIGIIFQKLFKHRGFLHSLIFFLIISFLVKIIFSDAYGYALLLGLFAHILGDGISKMGVRLFYPLKFRIKGPLRVGSFAEVLISFFIFCVIVLLLFFL